MGMRLDNGEPSNPTRPVPKDSRDASSTDNPPSCDGVPSADLDALLAWQDAYATGDAAIDADHRRLFTLLGHFTRTLAHQSPRSEVAERACDLVEFTREHFRAEEERMARMGDRHASLHKAEHDELLRQLIQWLFLFGMERRRFTLEDALFLRDWLVEHINGMDRALARRLAAD